MPTFILGAGFNVDATAEAGPAFGESLYVGRYQIDCGYPLVGDTLRLCFGLDRMPDGRSIEDLFSDAQQSGIPNSPLQKLAKRLMEADFRIARHLASDEKMNCYRRFFDAFAGSNFLTFNYDAVPETFLFRLGRWYPHDGYGLRVTAHLPPDAKELATRRSSAFVLHLHGSLCIRISEFEARRKPREHIAWLTERNEPRYAFDPSSISANFTPFERDVGAFHVEDRIIAPIPDKARWLNEPFVRDTYIKAEALMRDSDTVVTIGYSFNRHDGASYQRLLRALSESPSRRLVVVSPDADTVAQTIRPAFPNLSIEPRALTFKHWVALSFPGIDPGA